VPAAIVAGERVNLVHNHRAEVAEQAPVVSPARGQHDLERLGRRHQQVRRLAHDGPATTVRYIAVPHADLAPNAIGSHK
jgi:hypothetical protein